MGGTLPGALRYRRNASGICVGLTGLPNPLLIMRADRISTMFFFELHTLAGPLQRVPGLCNQAKLRS